MVEIAALAVSIVTLLLERLDKRSERLRDRPDLRDALIKLQSALRKWSEAAQATNNALEDWIAKGKPDSAPVITHLDSIRLARGLQLSFGTVMGIDITQSSGRRTNSPTLADTLSVYAPELKDQLAKISELRYRQLDDLRQELESYPATRSTLEKMLNTLGIGDAEPTLNQLTTEDIQGFREAEDALRRASSQLAYFSTEKFPLGSDD